ARVYLATTSQLLGIQGYDEDDWPSNQKVLTDKGGAFSFPAQFERYALVVTHDDGYAEVSLKPDQQPGDLALKPWARVEGRLLQAGRPVAPTWLLFQPLRLHGDGSPHIQDHVSVQTDRAGRFVFPRVPPVKSSVQALMSVSGEAPIRSRRSIPLDLQPGQRVEVDLGGQGTTVTGRVVLAGDAAATIDLNKSMSWLARR